MHDNELEELLIDLESDSAERKESISDIKKIKRVICAFANDLPNNAKQGVLFIGARDDGTPSNLPIDDDLLIRLSNIRSDGNILPFPNIAVKKRTLSGSECAVVIVTPSDSPPVRYDGRVYVRVGPSTRLASPEEERRLTEKRQSKESTFDLHPVHGSSLDEIDLDIFNRTYLPSAIPQDIIDQNARSIEEQLASMRFISLDKIPTVAGILVLGKEPRKYLPGAYVQFLRIDGEKTTDSIKDQKEIDGPFPELLRMLDEVIKAHISVASDFTSQDIELKHPDYPIVALQQIARNAVLHRTYEGTNSPVRITWFSDRVEIISPGGPYGLVTKENFGQPGISDYRNPHLAEAMKALGYIQRFGMGIQIARNQLEKNRNPPVEFDVQDTTILVTIRRRK